jgi:hypothetical protein
LRGGAEAAYRLKGDRSGRTFKKSNAAVRVNRQVTIGPRHRANADLFRKTGQHAVAGVELVRYVGARPGSFDDRMVERFVLAKERVEAAHRIADVIVGLLPHLLNCLRGSVQAFGKVTCGCNRAARPHRIIRRLGIMLESGRQLSDKSRRRGVELGIVDGLIEHIQSVQDGTLAARGRSRRQNIAEQGLVEHARYRGKTGATARRRHNVGSLA